MSYSQLTKSHSKALGKIVSKTKSAIYGVLALLPSTVCMSTSHKIQTIVRSSSPGNKSRSRLKERRDVASLPLLSISINNQNTTPIYIDTRSVFVIRKGPLRVKEGRQTTATAIITERFKQN